MVGVKIEGLPAKTQENAPVIFSLSGDGVEILSRRNGSPEKIFRVNRCRRNDEVSVLQIGVKRLSLAFAILGWSGVCFAQTPPAISSGAGPMQSTTTSSNDLPPQHLPGSTIAACRTSFPPLVFKAGEHPETTLTFTIGLEGGVKNVVVAEPSGYDQLDSAAVACVSTWRYVPANKNGQAVEVPQTLTIPWTTSDKF